MPRLELVLLGAFAAVLVGCSGGPVAMTTEEEAAASVTPQELSNHRRRFDENVGSSYTYEYQNVCFCAPDSRTAVRVTVTDGARVAVVRADDGGPLPLERWNEFLTVAEIFDDIQRALDEGAASARVEFDEALGYPRDVYIDVDERIADEERGYTVRNLRVNR